MAFCKILPMEITLDIFDRVPNESVLDCKFVCTSWNNILRHPSFSRMELHNFIEPSNSAAHSGKLGFLALTYKNDSFWYFEYNDNHDQSTPLIQRITRINLTPPFTRVKFLGSCNGLIFLARYPYLEAASLCICNPSTREQVLIPEIERDWDTDDDDQYICWRDWDTDVDICWSHSWTSGFGYVSSLNEYKVVRIMLMLKTGIYTVCIYTLGSGNGWRNLGKFNLGSNVYLTECFFANEALYWLDRGLDMIVTFDLAEEKFREHLSLPSLSPYTNSNYNRIGVVDGFLFFAMHLVVEESGYYQIWLLKKKNDFHGMREWEERQSFAWSKEFRVDDSELLALTKSEGALTYNYNDICIYDTKASTSKRLVVYKENFRQIFPHKNTLVSLKELGEKDVEITRSSEAMDRKS